MITKKKAVPVPKPAPPTQFCFGTGPLPRLTRAQEVDAPFEERLRSVWPYLVGNVKKFNALLTPRERANYDGDDLMEEVAMALWKKDGKWSPARGRYITFSEQVCRSTLLGLRPKMRPVHTPANAPGRMRQYEAKVVESGGLKPAQVKIMGRLAQVLNPVDDVDDVKQCPQLTSDREPTPEAAIRREESDLAGDDARACLAAAGPLGALVLTRLHGLFGSPPQEPRALASSLAGWTATRILEVAARAESQIRNRYTEEDHP